MRKACFTCKHYNSFEWVCENELTDRFKEYAEPRDNCRLWEEKQQCHD